MIEQKNILSLSPFNPFKPYSGTTSRIFHISRYLSEKNKLFMVIRNEKNVTPTFPCETILNSSNRFTNLLNIPLILKLVRLIRKEQIDYIHVSTVLMGLYGIILKLICRVPFILDEHNVEFLRLKRTGKLFWPVMYIYEKVLSHFADSVLCVSEVDKEYFVKYIHKDENKYQVIQNGVDSEMFQHDEKKRQRTRNEIDAGDKTVMYFNGHMNYKPNIEALDFIADKLCPALKKYEKDVLLLIIGGGEIEKELSDRLSKYPFVKICGFVDKIEDYIIASDICLVPLFSGSGTRLKILEALSCGRTVVSTKIGAEGIDEAFPNLKISSSIDAFTVDVEDIVSSGTAVSMHENPQLKKFIKGYYWKNIVKKITLETK